MNTKRIGWVLAAAIVSCLSFGCSTAPKQKNQQAFIQDAQKSTQWFTDHIHGLDQQIDEAAAYIVYPAVRQWGFGISGGQFGRGLLARPDGTQIGWGAINTASGGLQIGGRGFKMFVVFENEETLNKFIENKLTGSVAAVSVVGKMSKGKAGSFTNGVVIYEGDSTGLLAGVNVGLNYMRYKELDEHNDPDHSLITGSPGG